ncbi:MAG: Stp1/IreP family PP2C-type Ser/Thr phosphatase [Solirubrobacteraceae bacterium]|nr:MAG: Stp1/IreP family PP2C-type Ser/Thr phosphatase [Solirubrobacterales bacterium]
MLQIVDYAELTDTGLQRRSNEDALYASPPVFVVADGMGGAQAGEVASGIAIDAFAGGLPSTGSAEERLAAVARDANTRIHELASADRQRAGMGSTLIAAYLDGDGVAIAHVGDSRAYRWREGELERLTRDHSLVGMWIERGDITEEEAEEHPQRSVITRALGPEPNVDIETQTSPARPGDLFLLCSDGLTSMIPDAEIGALLGSGGALKEIAERLVGEANSRGGRDNITVVLFRVGGGADTATGEQPAAGEADAAAQADEAGVTQVGESAPTAAEVRAALAASQPAAAAQAPAEAGAEARSPWLVAPDATATDAQVGEGEGRRTIPPRPPAPPPQPRRRRHARRYAFATFVVLVLVALGVGGWLASRDVYFVSTTPDGFVAVDRGLPYDLPFGVHLYSTVFRSGVAADELAPARRATLLNHKLRSQSDAFSLVRDIDAGKLTP